ncbi:DNA-processing protein DprA [Entomobacter blattae]|uniref:DNA recombination-mediator protein A n=1 Tax=Entomobacter blattae TaxID=2762277 RepID=A0A7H1NUP1_9PROT|nr:DNA-processing protein DprA [Entomobacter blattae]QNT79501.1 DNA recombination-mediator protein A [Entomobacter blattae]
MPLSSASAWSTDRVTCLQLARTEGIGPKTYRKLMQRFSTPREALHALPSLLQRAGRPTPPIPQVQDMEREMTLTEQMGGFLLFLGQPDYPPLLAEISDPPPVIACLGNQELLNQKIIGIVGARNASAGGLKLAALLADELAKEGLVLISGLARGIDGAVHRAALNYKATIAALAGGLDYFYPPEHKNMQKDIAEKGLLITEAPLGTAPLSQHFPRRNRLIAGLSLGCIIVEAAIKSGSLITAQLCIDYQRTIFAVPGFPLDPRSAGANALLRDGATLTENAEDVLRELASSASSLSFPPSSRPHKKQQTPPLFSSPLTRLPKTSSPLTPANPPKKNLHQPAFEAGPPLSSPASTQEPTCSSEDKRNLSLNSCQQAILSFLSTTPVSTDELIRLCQEPAHVINIALAELELAGHIELRSEGYILLQG